VTTASHKVRQKGKIRSLPLDLWPEADRNAWNGACRPAARLRPGGAAGHLKAVKISEAFIARLHADFVQHGASAIERVREERPADYLKVIASILPKELHVQDVSLEDMSDDELMDILAALRSFVAKGAKEVTEH
jgi:hypothetical protein